MARASKIGEGSDALVVLEMSENEAKAIVGIGWAIGGHPDTTIRGLYEGVMGSLRKAGILSSRHLEVDDYHDIHVRGSIVCQEVGSDHHDLT